MNFTAPFDDYEPPGIPPERHKPGKKRFRLMPFDKIRADETSAYRIKGFLPRVGLVVVWGPPKCGKSFYVFDLMMHVALGWMYRGHRVQGGSVVYAALEGCQGFKARVEAFRQAKMSEGASAAFHLMAEGLNLVADGPAFVAAIREQVAEQIPAVVVVDTLNRSLQGSESSDEDMANYVRAADAIRDAFDCLVVIVHHCGHGGDRPRGHSSLIGALDVQISVKRDAADQVIAELELAKDGAPGLQFVSKLEQIEIGIDADGDAITSCVIQPVEGAAVEGKEGKGAKLTKGAQIALRALNEALGECGAIPPASNHIPAGVKSVTTDQWRDYAYRLGVSGSNEARAKQVAFQRAHEALIAANRVAVWEPFAWIV